MNKTKTEQIFHTLSWLGGGLVAWIFGLVAWMTIIAPRLPQIISYTHRRLHPVSSLVLFVIEALPHAIFGFLLGIVLSAFMGCRKFFVFAAVAVPCLLSLTQGIDNYQYESLIYRGDIPNSIISGMIERQAIALVVFPAAIWAGATLANRYRRITRDDEAPQQ